jgi:hypothetical protein
MFGTRTLLGLGSIALGVAGFQTPAHAGNFSVGLNLNLGPSRPAVIVPAAPVQAQYVAPVVPARVIQPSYYQPSVYQPSYYQPTYAPSYSPSFAPVYTPSYRLPAPNCDTPHHHHHHNNIQQSNWRYNNSPYWR